MTTSSSARSQEEIAGFVVVVFGLAFMGLLPWPERLVAPGLLSGARRSRSNILLGGEFTLVNGILRRGVAKIRGNDRQARFYGIAVVGNTARVSFVSTPGINYILQASSNLVSWTSLSTNNAPGDTLTLVDPAANLHKKRFYRVRQAGQ